MKTQVNNTDHLTERLFSSILLESLKKLVDIAYDRFDDDFTLDELESLEGAADIIGDSVMAMTVRNRIEKKDHL